MRALRFHGNKDIRIDDIPEPSVKDGYVKIKIAWNGICGSDLHEYRIGPKNTRTTPHPVTGETLPAVCGHEFSGTVAELADNASGWKIGDKVAVFPVVTDGSCDWCQQEAYGCCPNWGFLGYSGGGGGMSEYIVVREEAIYKIPEHVSLDVAALVEPLAVGWHAVKLAKAGPGDCCLVLGAGPIGLAVVLALIANGISNIIVSEISSFRASRATEAGASHVVSPKTTDVSEFVRQNSEGGQGAHAVFECAGHPSAFATAVDAVRGRGTIINVAVYEASTLEIPNPNKLNRYQITLMGSNIYYRGEFQDVIDAIASGSMKNPEAMITGRVPLEKAIEDGFRPLLDGVEGHIKILVSPTLAEEQV